MHMGAEPKNSFDELPQRPPMWQINHKASKIKHTCPEAKPQFFELFMDTTNGFLLLLSHIKNIVKA